MPLLKIIDAENNMEYEVEVTREEAALAERDIEFATKLLQDAQQPKQPSILCSEESTSAVTAEIFDVDDQQPTPSSIPGVFMWTVPTTKYFISLYKKYEGGLSSGRITYKMVWDKISKEMRVAGFPVSSKQCSSKLTSLKRMYKAIKEHNSKSGNDRRKWLYYELCDEIFSNKPWMEPLSTISSENDNVTTSAAIRALEAENSENSRSSKPSLSSNTKNKKFEKFLEFKEREADRKENQHKEKMARLDKMNGLLEQILVSRNK